MQTTSPCGTSYQMWWEDKDTGELLPPDVGYWGNATRVWESDSCKMKHHPAGTTRITFSGEEAYTWGYEFGPGWNEAQAEAQFHLFALVPSASVDMWCSQSGWARFDNPAGCCYCGGTMTSSYNPDTHHGEFTCTPRHGDAFTAVLHEGVLTVFLSHCEPAVAPGVYDYEGATAFLRALNWIKNDAQRCSALDVPGGWNAIHHA